MSLPTCPECLADLDESIPVPAHGTCPGCGCYFKEYDLTNGGMEMKMNFKTQAKNFLEGVEKQATRRTFDSLLRNHLLPAIGELDLKDVGNGALKSLAITMKGLKLSPSTIQSALTLAKLVVGSAVGPDGDKLYPREWNNKFIGAPEVVQTKQDAPTTTGKAIQEAISRDFRQDKALWALLAGTGLRIGEALALMVGVDDGQNSIWNPGTATITIRSTVVEGKIQFSPKSEAGNREVDLSPELNSYLIRTMLFGRESGLMFRSETGGIFRAASGYQHLPTTIPGFHSLRRFRITHLRSAGVPEGLIQYWAGHANKSITDRYDKIGKDVEKRKLWAEKAGLGFKLERGE